MKVFLFCFGRRGVFAGIVLAIFLPQISPAQTRTLRIVDYNIEADVNSGYFGPLPGLIAPPTATNNYAAGGLLEGIGEELVNGNAQPLDILALEETTSNSLTVVPIVNGLNTFYGIAGLYSNSSYQAVQSGGTSSGNGPNAIVFNTRTLQLLASTPIDPPGGTSNLGGVSSGKSGMLREVMSYEFAPAGVAANSSNTFYIYVSHYKSGDSSNTTDSGDREGEATIVRSNMMSLPSGSQILHVGDFNTGDASEQMYGTLTAPGTNQLIDVLNPSRSLTTNFDDGPTIDLTEEDYRLEYRDDYQMMTTNIFYGSGGMKYLTNTFHVFANNGTIAYLGTANTSANTALNNRLVTNGPVFISAAQLLLDLTNASDHLPVVADYTIPIPAPQIVNIGISGSNLIFSIANGITNEIYSLLATTNLSSPNWTPVATNTASGGNVNFTATNAVNLNSSSQFYLLEGK